MFENDLTPDDIQLTSVSKSFEYEKISREIDTCDDVEILRKIAKLSLKLTFKQQETLSMI